MSNNSLHGQIFSVFRFSLRVAVCWGATFSGNGLQFVGDAPFSASALNYSIESLDDGVQKDQRHSPEVAKAPFTNLCIDKVQMGLGCVNSWGTLPLEKYRVPYQDYEFSFILTPVRHKVNM